MHAQSGCADVAPDPGAGSALESAAAAPDAAAADSGPEPFDVSYVEAFTSVLHNLITLFTAPPSSSNPPAEAWVIPSLLTVCSASEVVPLHLDACFY